MAVKKRTGARYVVAQGDDGEDRLYVERGVSGSYSIESDEDGVYGLSEDDLRLFKSAIEEALADI